MNGRRATLAPHLASLAILANLLALTPDGATARQRDPGLPGGGATFREILSLRSVGGPVISPSGEDVAYTLSRPDWSLNRSASELWIVRGDQPHVRIATEEDGYRGSVQWTPDGRWLAFRDGRTLVFLSPNGQDRRTVDMGLEGIGAFQLSPDGSAVAVLAREPGPERARREQELYGPFTFRDEDSPANHIWLVSVDEDGPPRRLTAGSFTVTDMAWSPDGAEIAFVHQADGGRNSWWKADISVVEVSSGALRPLVTEAGPDTSPMWSPDGSRIAFLSTLSDSITNLPRELVTVPAEGGRPRVLTADLATEPTPLVWTEDGILIGALEGVEGHIFRLEPDRGTLTRLSYPPYLILPGSGRVSGDGSVLVFTAMTADGLAEIYRTPTATFAPTALTSSTEQVAGWDLGTREVVRWTGPGGVAIEGVLTKPSDFDPERRYPLLVIVHGGPRSVSTPALRLAAGVYPVMHFISKGALVLMPNYRGSTGYGGEFRQLHRRGVGWGDAGDVEAGVAHLVAEGIVDADRVGVMGWSYGGFISAYLTATSKAFRAVSVGAGITDWRTHYAWEPSSYTTRIYSFDASPWEDPNAYQVASPITYINTASTPTLIQHVDGDPVVTVLNAYELQHALQDRGIENRFVIYPGRSHGVGPMRQRLGALWHNWQWFLRHIWNENVELPLDGD